MKLLLKTFLFVFVSLMWIVKPEYGHADKIRILEVSVKEVPGLLAYVKKNFPDIKINRKTVSVNLVDLDEIPDGVDEIILGVKDFLYCGSGGCDYRVLKRSSKGKLIEISVMLTNNLVVIEGYTNGYRNLAPSTFNNSASMKADKQEHRIIHDGVAKPTKKNSEPPGQQQSFKFTGPCFERTIWTGGGNFKNGGSASYGGCGDGEYTYLFECTPNSSEILLTVEDALPNAIDGAPVRVSVLVDGKEFNLKGIGRYSDMIGGTQPLLRFDSSNGLLDALIKGTFADILVGRGGGGFHLKGSSGAIEAMLAACPRALEAIGNKKSKPSTVNRRSPIINGPPGKTPNFFRKRNTQNLPESVLSGRNLRSSQRDIRNIQPQRQVATPTQIYCWYVSQKGAGSNPDKIQAFETWCPGQNRDYDVDQSAITCSRKSLVWRFRTDVRASVSRMAKNERIWFQINGQKFGAMATFDYSEMNEKYYANVVFNRDHQFWQLLKIGNDASIIVNGVSNQIGTTNIAEAINTLRDFCGTVKSTRTLQ